MKRTILLILASALILSACTVGPKEEPRETLGTPDVSIPDNVMTDEIETDEEDPVDADPLPDEVEQPDEIIPPAEPDDVVTEPAAEPDGEPLATPEDGEIAISDAEYGIMYSTISLNVREGPSTDYSVKGTLKEGEAVEIIGYASDYGWYLIKFKNGTGYVSGSYMTAVNPNLMDEPDDDYLPAIYIDMDRIYEIINAYAEYSGYWPIDVVMTGYFGDYSAGAAVEMSIDTINYDESDTAQEFNGYTLKHADSFSEFFIYTPSGKFVVLSDAYNNGTVSDSDMRAICYYAGSPRMHNIGENEPTGYPQLAALDSSAQAAINADYEKANGLVAGAAYIQSYYGTYSGGDAVVMWTYDPYFLPDEKIGIPVTDDMQDFYISKRHFVLSSGSYSITIHTKDGKFIDLRQAYIDGIMSDKDLDSICYYNRYRNR